MLLSAATMVAESSMTSTFVPSRPFCRLRLRRSRRCAAVSVPRIGSGIEFAGRLRRRARFESARPNHDLSRSKIPTTPLSRYPPRDPVSITRQRHARGANQRIVGVISSKSHVRNAAPSGPGLFPRAPVRDKCEARPRKALAPFAASSHIAQGRPTKGPIMRAAFYDRVGPAKEVLQVGELPTPAAGPGEVRVKLAWSGVNPSDVKSRLGLRSKTLPFPRIVPHSDGAGVIDQAGAGVPASRIGERVWVWNGAWGRPSGTAAQYIALPSAQAVPLPEGVDPAAGACLGIPALTACHAIDVDG